MVEMLKVEDLKEWFPVRKTFTEMVKGKSRHVRAVDGISFEAKKGEIFGLVGESGCGKTTTGKIIAKLIGETSGKIYLGKNDASTMDEREYKKKVQMIFQDPYASLNPRFRIRDVVEEPLILQKIGNNRVERMERIIKALHEVKIEPPEDFMTRFPHMLSGGQKQRVSIARTLVLSPELIVADEPVSMVDLSTRAEILHLMGDIKKRLSLTYVYITHDLSTARYFTDRMAVMYLGKIVEIGASDDIIDKTAHPYTKALIEAVPTMEIGKTNLIKKIPIKGEIPSATNIPPGCRFHPRCPYATDICKREEPEYRDLGNGHLVACHHLF